MPVYEILSKQFLPGLPHDDEDFLEQVGRLEQPFYWTKSGEWLGPPEYWTYTVRLSQVGSRWM